MVSVEESTLDLINETLDQLDQKNRPQSHHCSLSVHGRWFNQDNDHCLIPSKLSGISKLLFDCSVHFISGARSAFFFIVYTLGLNGVCRADMSCHLCSASPCEAHVILVCAEGVKCATFLFPANQPDHCCEQYCRPPHLAWLIKAEWKKKCLKGTLFWRKHQRTFSHVTTKT